jgi:hypothetical protein
MKKEIKGKEGRFSYEDELGLSKVSSPSPNAGDDIRKSNYQEALDNLFTNDISKGRAASVGEIRVWGGKKFRKQANGKWVEVSDQGKTRKEHVKLGNKNPYKTSAKTVAERKELEDRFNRHRNTHHSLASKLEDKEYTDEELGVKDSKEEEGGDDIEKAMNHKYYKREGVKGNYKYYYTKEEYDKTKKGKSEGVEGPEMLDSKYRRMIQAQDDYADSLSKRDKRPDSEKKMLKQRMVEAEKTFNTALENRGLTKEEYEKGSKEEEGGGSIESLLEKKAGLIEKFNKMSAEHKKKYGGVDISEPKSEAEKLSEEAKNKVASEMDNLVREINKKKKEGGDDIEKSDVFNAFQYSGDKPLTFKKKGSEFKEKLQAKLSVYLTREQGIKEAMSESELKLKEQGVEFLSRDEYGYPIYDCGSIQQGSDALLKDLHVFNDLKYKCRGIKEDIDTMRVLLENIDDNKDYELTIKQLTGLIV